MKLAACLEVSGIPYMMTGSIVSSLHGEPRSTHDIDVIVQIFRALGTFEKRSPGSLGLHPGDQVAIRPSAILRGYYADRPTDVQAGPRR